MAIRKPETIQRQLQKYLGRKRGKLRIVSYVGMVNNYHAFNCLCDQALGGCGKQKVLPGAYVIQGRVSSCGCVRRVTKETRRKRRGDMRYPMFRGGPGFQARKPAGAQPLQANQLAAPSRLDLIRNVHKNRVTAQKQRRLAVTLDMLSTVFRSGTGVVL